MSAGDGQAPPTWTVAVVDGPTAAVPPGSSVTVGRASDCDLPVPDDPRLSRRHFTARAAADGRLTVRDETGGANPPFLDGEPVAGSAAVAARSRLAAGRTRFRLLPPAPAAPAGGAEPLTEGTLGAGDWHGEPLTIDARTLAAAPLTRPDRRFEAVARLPEVLRTPDDALRLPALCGLLLAGVGDADAAAVLAADDGGTWAVREWAGRDELADPPAVPRAAVAAAVRTREAAVASSAAGWACVVPVVGGNGGDGDRPVARALLLAGSGGAPADRTADVRFVSLVADILAAADRAGRLERQTAALRPFLPPRVLASLGDDPDPARLAPVECTATVLFCDLRGFSRTSEELADDLPKLLARVSAALAVMTRRIREFGGVTGDFLGDAALAFWGWPEADPAAPANAARAALGVAADFAAGRPAGDPLAGFRVGVGLATGPAVAGRIGTDEQAKITVFGPVANLASRLEGLCRPLRAAVVCDAATAAAVRNAADVRVRPLATVRPAGMANAEAVSELLPPAGSHPLSDPDLARYADAVAAFTSGDWPRAADLLQAHPSSDLAQDFLRATIAEHHRTAPPGWDGAVRMDAK